MDGERVHLVTVGTPEDFKIDVRRPGEHRRDRRSSTRGCRCACRSRPGRTSIGVTFVAKTAALEPLKLRPLLNQADGVDTYGIPKVDTVTIVGPFNVTGPGDTPSRRADLHVPPGQRGSRSCRAPGPS